jgi:hypothetical protein
MTIYTKVTIGGSEFNDFKRIKIRKTSSDHYTSSNTQIDYDSPFGLHKNDFSVGKEIKIYSNKDATPSTCIFTGLVESVDFQGEETRQSVNLMGRDYSARLLDNTIKTTVYTNTEIGSIVRDILLNNASDITYSGVNSTPTTLKRISFSQIPIFDGIKQLADLANYSYYIDENKDFHFEPTGSIFTNYNFYSGNIVYMDYDKTREGMSNKIYVYGDRQLAGTKQLCTLNGSAWGGAPGSVYTLFNKPYNTYVEYLGSVRKGGVFQMVSTPTSGIDYYVSFEDKQLIFVSGTNLGYSSIPVSGGSIAVTYDRDIPIIKYGENKNSIKLYGPKTKVINDKTIKDPNTATDILNAEIQKADPFNNIECQVKGWYNINPNQIVGVNLPDFKLNDNYPVIAIDYNFDKQTVQSEEVITLKLDKKAIDITDRIRDLKNRIEYLESSDRQTTDPISRLEYAQGTQTIVGSRWIINRQYTGSDYLWGRSLPSKPFVWGITGSGLWLGSYSYPNKVLLYSGGYAYQ